MRGPSVFCDKRADVVYSTNGDGFDFDVLVHSPKPVNRIEISSSIRGLDQTDQAQAGVVLGGMPAVV